MIREATADDIPKLVEMGRSFNKASPYSVIGFDDEAVGALFYRMIKSDEAAILVRNDLNGCVGLILSPFFFFPEKYVCNELFWWVSPEYRGQGARLIKHAEKWALSKGAIFAPSSIQAMNGDAVNAIYERLGYQKAETIYLKVK